MARKSPLILLVPVVTLTNQTTTLIRAGWNFITKPPHPLAWDQAFIYYVFYKYHCIQVPRPNVEGQLQMNRPVFTGTTTYWGNPYPLDIIYNPPKRVPRKYKCESY